MADVNYGADAMPDDHSDDLLERLEARVRAGGGSRSKLTVWMTERQDALASLISRLGADWDGWAEDFIKDGLMPAPAHWGEEGPEGAAAKRRAAETARMTWTRLQERLRKQGRGPRRPKATSAAPEVQREAKAVTDDVVARRRASLDSAFKERS